MKAKKSLGQNFLINKDVITYVIKEMNLNENDLVIEIGPGKGALTEEIKKFCPYLIAYEIDKDLNIYLNKYIDNKTKVIYKDFLNVNIKEDIKNIKYDNLYIIGNLPYYITTPILEHIIKENIEFKEAYFMVQKEVANRFMAQPNSKEYGFFTLYLKYYYEIRKVIDVSKKNFFPVPKVNSTIIKLMPRDKKKIDENKYFDFLKKAFKQKRKTLKNNIDSETFNKILPVLNEFGFKDNVRAEEIPEELYLKIYNL
jgi:16S rRNA (adenine1518-N6/adenine1519-N6)-dimethyltransferase